MSFALPIDPTPRSIEALVERLPASARATIAWFPAELRRSIIDPLRDVESRDLNETMRDLAPTGVRLLIRLASATADLLEDSITGAALSSAPTVDELLHQKQRTLSVAAADDLDDAYGWLRAILGAILSEQSTDLAALARAAEPDVEPTDDEIREGLRGGGGAFLRGILWTIAAVEAVLDDKDKPAALETWCELARLEMHAAANVLRGAGIAVPTALRPPTNGLPAGLRTGPLPPGILELIVNELSPEELWLFGSRAEGTHAPASDWDLMAVVSDEAASSGEALRDRLRRRRVDLFVAARAEFEAGKDVRGSLSHLVHSHGVRLR